MRPDLVGKPSDDNPNDQSQFMSNMPTRRASNANDTSRLGGENAGDEEGGEEEKKGEGGE